MSSEQSFTLAIPDADLDILRKKLELVRLPDELEDANWDYGVPLADVQRLVARWRSGFDWRATEAKINQLPQFTRDIEVDGFGKLNIHYVHQKSSAPDAIPLIFIHGWPGHFWEVSKILPLLTSSSEKSPSFHVVALSLPGFGFSEAPKKKGFSVAQFAEVSHKLMLALGYNEYVAQGGDWGHLAARNMAYKYPEHVKAWHTNFPFCQPPSPLKNPFLFLRFMVTPFSKRDWAGIHRMMDWVKNGQGYSGIQQTRPQTHGYSLADSPVSLLAWIYDKLVAWTDDYKWDDDEVLSWVSIYWFSRAGPAASSRIYAEFHKEPSGVPPYTSVPLGISYFPKEIIPVPKLWTRTIGNVVFDFQHEAGGHFAAYERPEDLVDDLRSMFSKERGLKLF
ncbi:alpha/beta-hydrolase [Cristinia sonorae]|uniref:Alpha/beta-hydrolase n=1 Tax=Cristinia sonorae TaxID=1940300 RepID=A0A8K0XRG3_9AGAR|nr:alpha/beta-hydrolase [Cristinia sonorae]